MNVRDVTGESTFDLRGAVISLSACPFFMGRVAGTPDQRRRECRVVGRHAAAISTRLSQRPFSGDANRV